jgi:hypothetical protein
MSVIVYDRVLELVRDRQRPGRSRPRYNLQRVAFGAAPAGVSLRGVVESLYGSALTAAIKDCEESEVAWSIERGSKIANTSREKHA